VTETARALLSTVVLAGSGLAFFAWRLARLEVSEPDRLIGELRFSQWMALVLSVTGGAWLGVAAINSPTGYGALEVTVAVTTILFAGWTLQREPRQSLMLLCGAFLFHALIDVSHRPGWLPQGIAPRWFTVGTAAFDVFMAALCFWVQRR
jgi:hypothetical protein